MKLTITKKLANSFLISCVAAALSAMPPLSMAEEVASKDKSGITKQVNINKADAQSIANALVGVGAVKAKAIVKYRDEHGKFNSVDQLREVQGMSSTLVNNNKSRIVLE